MLRGTKILKKTVRLEALPDNYGLQYSERVFGLVVTPRHDAVVVQKVLPGSHAANARLRPGDLIAEVAGSEITTVEEYEQAMERHIGDLPLTFMVVRDNRGYYINLP